MLQTQRLVLRQWQNNDLTPFAELNADAITMQYFPHCLSRNESDALAKRCQSIITTQGWGFWAVELNQTKEFIGLVGLHQQMDKFSFSPCVEIGWRLRKAFWHQGYAYEAANKALEYAFNQLALNEIVAFTAVNNIPSRKLMTKLGMQNTEQNFLHPDLPTEHPLAEHALYNISSSTWLMNNE